MHGGYSYVIEWYDSGRAESLRAASDMPYKKREEEKEEAQLSHMI